MFGELSMNPSNYVRSPAQARQYIPLALGHPCQARHEFSNLVLCRTKALPGPIFGPAPGRWTQSDITIMGPSNICFFLLLLTHTAFVDQWNDSRIDQQADTQNVRCRGVADRGRMVVTPALLINEWADPQKVGMFTKSCGRKPRRNTILRVGRF